MGALMGTLMGTLMGYDEHLAFMLSRRGVSAGDGHGRVPPAAICLRHRGPT
jgi:hypothetical protein